MFKNRKNNEGNEVNEILKEEGILEEVEEFLASKEVADIIQKVWHSTGSLMFEIPPVTKSETIKGIAKSTFESEGGLTAFGIDIKDTFKLELSQLFFDGLIEGNLKRYEKILISKISMIAIKVACIAANQFISSATIVENLS